MAYTTEQISGKIADIIVDQLDCDVADITPAANIVDDLGADSLEVIYLVESVEEEFSIDIPDEDAERLTTVGKLIAYVAGKVEA